MYLSLLNKMVTEIIYRNVTIKFLNINAARIAGEDEVLHSKRKNIVLLFALL